MREHLVSFSSIPLRLRNTYLAFLAKNGLTDEGDCDFTAMLLDDLDNILACGSLRGNVLKQIAVTPSAEGSGYCAQIISALVAESFERGAAHQFLYTKPMHRNIFRSMGFYPIVETNDVLMMENRPRGIQTFLKSLPHPSGKVGAVVCNCNPFTLGHRHLIEQASRSCDAVLVFVLSEDASFFSAAENWCRLGAFLLWNLLTFLPWGILCHSKYKTSEPQDFYHGIAGILTQLSFFSGIVFLTVGNDLQTVLEYDICRYCAGLLLLEVPAFCLTAFAFSLKKESWRCPDATLAIAAWCCALFLFCTGLFFLKVSV